MQYNDDLQRLHKYWVMPWSSDPEYIADRWYMRRQYSYSTIIPGPVHHRALTGLLTRRRSRAFPHELAVLMIRNRCISAPNHKEE